MSINKVILVGNVGKDPEVKHLDSNSSVANFTLATSDHYTNKNGEKVTTTEWHNIVCWRGLATIAENYIRKGSQIYVEGKIRTRSYDAQDGSKRYITEILADTIQLLGKKNDGANTEGSSVAQSSGVSEPLNSTNAYGNDDKEGDDLPF
ncbi:MAG TPA: single-stranded DNA-binding protein [Prolixibacteraceae bacterium]|jgi:single-strand DNA-binding protein